MTTTDTERQVADEMAEVKARTTDDGTVKGEVVAIEKNPPHDTRYTVTVELPYGDPIEHRFHTPDAWTDEYAFVRWVEHYGYTAENVNRMVEDGSRVTVAVDDGACEVVVPDPEPTLADRVAPVRERASRYSDHAGWLLAIAASLYPVYLFTWGHLAGHATAEDGVGGAVAVGVAAGMICGLSALFVFGPVLGWIE